MEPVLETTDTLTVEIEGAHTTTAPTAYASWLDTNSSLGRLAVTITGATPVTAVTAPTTSVSRMVRSLIIANLDTVAHVVTVKQVVSGGATTVIWSENVAAGAVIDLLSQLREGPQGDGISTIHSMGEKTSPTGADEIIVADSAAAWIAKRMSLTNLVTYLGTALSGVFAALSHAHAGSAITSGTVGAAYLGAMTGDSGEGGAKGAVPAPGAGDAAAGKYLKADGTWAVPAGGGTSRWTDFSGFNATAASKCGLILTSDLPVMMDVDGITRLPIRYKCTGDSGYRYGVVLQSGGDTSHTPHSGTAQAGTYGTDPLAATITLAAGASATDDYYNNMIVEIVSGTGVGQRALIGDYNGTTKVATLFPPPTAYGDAFDRHGSKWNAAADSSSEYVMYHALIAGAPLDDATLTEMATGTPEQIVNVVIGVHGVYSDQTASTDLYRTLVKQVAPWQGSTAHIVWAGARNETDDTGTAPRINLVGGYGSLPLGDNATDGIEPIGGAGGELAWAEPGTIRLPNYETVIPGNNVDAVLTVPGGNGDAEDLTVCIVLVME